MMENQNGGPVTSGDGRTDGSNEADYRQELPAQPPGSPPGKSRIQQNEEARDQIHAKAKIEGRPTQRIGRDATKDGESTRSTP